jgi:hypothetical protein
MSNISIVLTALPHGRPTATTLRVSVHVAPRLSAPQSESRPTLAEYAPWFADWPKIVQGMSFAVQFGPGPLVPATQVGTPPESALWTALFPPTTYVRPYSFTALDTRLIWSYPVANVRAHLLDLFQRYGTQSPDQHPLRETLLADPAITGVVTAAVAAGRITPAAAGTAGQAGLQIRAQVETSMRRPREREMAIRGRPSAVLNAVPPGPPNVPVDYFQVANFYTPRGKQGPPTSVTRNGGTYQVAGSYPRLPKIIPIPEIDFHQMLSTLAEYPAAMRRLGVVIELEIPMQQGIVSSASGTDVPSIQVIPTWPSGLADPPAVILPRTVYFLDQTHFIAAPQAATPEVTTTGLLRVRDKTSDQQNVFDLVEIDTDGGALKFLDYAANLSRTTMATVDTSATTTLPSLRSAGISMVRVGAAARLAGSFQVQADRYAKTMPIAMPVLAPNTTPNLPASSAPPLYAEDVMRGYRVDVRPTPAGKWFSLHARTGSYDMNGVQRTLDDEGYTQTAVLSAAADPSDTDLLVHEVFARWDGWSLSIPRIGSSLDNSMAVVGASSQPAAPGGLKLHTALQVPAGTLPRLRFNTGYRLRVRAVDLAGNSADVPGDGTTGPLNPIDPADLTAATDELVYRRYEPLVTPALILRTDISKSPGEALETLVIRTFNTTPQLDTTPITGTAERHVAPPAMPWNMCATHGVLDSMSATDQYNLISQHEGSFTPSAPNPTKTGAGSVNPIVGDAQISSLPYLPDPAAKGVAFIGLPGTPTVRIFTGFDARLSDKAEAARVGGGGGAGTVIPSVFSTTYQVGGGGWWDMKPFRLVVADGTGQSSKAPSWSGNVLTIYLDKAEVATVRYDSLLTDSVLESMGLWNWLISSPSPKIPTSTLRSLALEGRLWMLTPYRSLRFVHAVQQPLAIPEFGTLGVARSAGATFATLTDSMTVHPQSTAKVDLRGDWSEWIDIVTEPAPRQITGTTHVAEYLVAVPEDPTIQIDTPHHFGDTKYRSVLYSATATTRFREYLDPSLLADPANITRTTIANPSTATDPHRSLTRIIPSSARPPAPKLLYVVPSFEWSAPTASGAPYIRSTRLGWLRVYLDRPWYSSGDGELLGVLFWNDAFASIPTEYREYVTQWGTDPIWTSQATTGGASEGSFANAANTKIGGLTLEELTFETIKLLPLAPTTTVHSKTVEDRRARTMSLQPVASLPANQPPPPAPPAGRAPVERVGGQPPVTVAQKPVAQPPAQAGRPAKESGAARGVGVGVGVNPLQPLNVPALGVAGYAPQFDPVRKLWFADIRVDAGPAYFPFVRLALVRYQPNSIDGAFISRVVIADYAQLTPDRSVALAFDPKQPRRVAVEVVGTPHLGSDAERPPRAIEVVLETRQSNAPDFAWVPVNNAKIQQAPPRALEERRSPTPIPPAAKPIWSGEVNLPDDRGKKPFRIVVREYETYLADPAVAEAGAVVGSMVPQSRMQRIVFADAVEI